MRVYAGLLRAVNVAGHNAVTMAALKEFLGQLGLENARTVLASGNFVAGAADRDASALEGRLEREAARRLKLTTEFFVRTPADWSEVVARNPFPREARDDPARLAVVFMKSAPSPAAVKRLAAVISGREVVGASGRHLYAYYPDGMGRSKLSNQMIERHLGASGTARNWNTVLRLEALLRPA
jgi:uncharacterized protein (DUF1697 family)